MKQRRRTRIHCERKEDTWRSNRLYFVVLAPFLSLSVTFLWRVSFVVAISSLHRVSQFQHNLLLLSLALYSLFSFLPRSILSHLVFRCLCVLELFAFGLCEHWTPLNTVCTLSIFGVCTFFMTQNNSTFCSGYKSTRYSHILHRQMNDPTTKKNMMMILLLMMKKTRKWRKKRILWIPCHRSTRQSYLDWLLFSCWLHSVCVCWKCAKHKSKIKMHKINWKTTTAHQTRAAVISSLFSLPDSDVCQCLVLAFARTRK